MIIFFLSKSLPPRFRMAAKRLPRLFLYKNGGIYLYTRSLFVISLNASTSSSVIFRMTRILLSSNGKASNSFPIASSPRTVSFSIPFVSTLLPELYRFKTSISIGSANCVHRIFSSPWPPIVLSSRFIRSKSIYFPLILKNKGMYTVSESRTFHIV